VGLITDGILHSNNTRDAESDGRAKIKTMAMGLGSKVSAWLYGFEVIFPFAWITALSFIGLLPYTTVLIFLTLPIAFGCAKTMMNSTVGGRQMIADLDVRTANLQLLFSLLLTVGLIVGKFIGA
jgi:1,4-dihydroxy-2-naphthoate octaprenyltransferase